MQTLPALYPGQLHLLLAARPTRYELVNALIARLAAGGQLLVLDGGNCFQAHRIARLLRRSTPHLEATLNNIHQNVVIALVTVTILLLGVLFGRVHMAGGMLIHEASVLIVILNGMRLLGQNSRRKETRFTPEFTPAPL